MCCFILVHSNEGNEQQLNYRYRLQICYEVIHVTVYHNSSTLKDTSKVTAHV